MPLQTVCVRHEPPGLEGDALDAHTRAWCDRVNASGVAYLTAAVLDGRWMVRVAMGAPTTERRHVEETWRAMQDAVAQRRPRDRDATTHVALVLDTLRGLLGEVDPTRARAAIGPDQSLTRELALGSLERVELAMRLEQAAGVELGETVLAEADTPRQIAAAIARATPAQASRGPPPRLGPGPEPGPQPGGSRRTAAVRRPARGR